MATEIIGALVIVIMYLLYRQFTITTTKNTKHSNLTVETPNKYYPNPSNILLPKPQNIFEKEIQSFTDPKISYKINLEEMTCSCPDFNKRRADKDLYSLERLCKHLKQVLIEQPNIQDTIFEAVLSDPYTSQYYYIHQDFPAIFGYTIHKEWINIFTGNQSNKFGKIQYSRYGYSLLEERWSYNLSPTNSDSIEEIINLIFPVGEKFYQSLGIALSEISSRIEFKINDKKLANVLNEFYDLTNTILQDNEIDDEEIKLLMNFLVANTLYLQNPPLDQLFTLLQNIVRDGRVTKKEKEQLLYFLLKIGNAIR